MTMQGKVDGWGVSSVIVAVLGLLFFPGIYLGVPAFLLGAVGLFSSGFGRERVAFWTALVGMLLGVLNIGILYVIIINR